MIKVNEIHVELVKLSQGGPHSGYLVLEMCGTDDPASYAEVKTKNTLEVPL